MGARTFLVVRDEPDLLAAFRAAVAAAQWEHGHRSETGTIAEKHTVRVVSPPRPMTDDERMAWAAAMLFDGVDDPALAWIEDKWAPAAALPRAAGGWIFFGWAPS